MKGMTYLINDDGMVDVGLDETFKRDIFDNPRADVLTSPGFDSCTVLSI